MIRAAAEAHLADADAAINTTNWAYANRSLGEGLAALGNCYVVAPAITIDETGMKLVAAQAEEKGGRVENAVQLRRRVLQTRLSMLQPLSHASN